MSQGMMRRLERLEDAARTDTPRQFIIWDQGPAHVEAEQQRLQRERGMTAADRIIVVGWLPVQDGPCAA